MGSEVKGVSALIAELDGCHNVPEGWVDPEVTVREEAKADLVQRIEFVETVTELPYRADLIRIEFTPEDLHILKEVLRKYSTTGHYIEYLEDELGVDEVFDQQTYVRENFIQKIDGALDEYVAKRPYSPFFLSFVKKIKKGNVRGDVDKLQVFRT
jgi:hypothetical protein